MLNRMSRTAFRHMIPFVFVCLAWLMLFPARPVWAEIPLDEAVWVCVTVPEFEAAFSELAAYREGQGLTTRVVSISDVSMWASGQLLPDTPSRIRWFAQRAYEEWGTRYLLLGGDYDDVPAPLTRRDVGVSIDIAPLDLYYACLDGDWDGDGDGWVAEPGDQYDHDPELAVGRLPCDDADQAAVMVAKTIGFEGRSLSRRGRVLLAASEFFPPVGDNTIGVHRVQDIITDLDGGEAPLMATPILQQWQMVPGSLVLSPEAFAAELAGNDYDQVYYFGQGSTERWSCGGGVELGFEHLLGLEGSGRTYVIDSNTCAGADILAEGILERLMALPDGGAVAARAYATLPFIAGMFHFDDTYWAVLGSGEPERLGDAHNTALVEAWNTAPTEFYRDHLPLLMLFGDPALVIRPAAATSVAPDPTFVIRDLEALPNPFNPSTIVSFAVEAPENVLVPVRVEIFDLRGRMIATLLDEDLPSGDHGVLWSTGGRSEGAGVYFARVTAGLNTGVVKLVRVD